MKTSTALDVIEQGRAVRRRGWVKGAVVYKSGDDIIIDYSRVEGSELSEAFATVRWIAKPEDLVATDWVDLGFLREGKEINWETGWSRYDERLQEFAIKVDAVRLTVNDHIDPVSYARNSFRMHMDTTMLWGKQAIQDAIDREAILKEDK
ncbi:hypothetical protein [Bacillus phage CP-51]|uniref:Thoeris anti-defense 2-like domain-containing protein n=1 Tax=Bacillus phage CP-51 TaxID=1391188 RepID=A0A068EP95_9CAUD|nr:hypothetical protein OZ73_gp064 [Bacillus phage CP-51]AID50499.1 hypothetical protein [Bacillus phage CP-51]